MQLRYRAALGAIRELQDLHGRLDGNEPLELKRLEDQLSTIEALLGAQQAEKTIAALGRGSGKP